VGIFHRTTKLRWRRKFRRRKEQVATMSVQAEEKLDKHFIRRMNKLVNVKRFVITWLLLVILLGAGIVVQVRALSNNYQKRVPAPGGIYTEGVIGSFTNANPIYASGAVDSAVSRLIFPGLLKFDSTNKLVGDIAYEWTVDDKEINYTVKLKDNVYWHDGKKLTAKDVAFTYATIQNPDTKSPLLSGWQGIKVTAQDDLTVVFTLPRPLASFTTSLTNGIIPKHLLDGISPAQLRSSVFNTANPVGTGPFKFDAVEVKGDTLDDRREQVGMIANDQYFMGRPQMDRFIISTFRDEQALVESYKKGELDAMVGLESTPETIDSKTQKYEYSIPITGEIVVFFRNSNEILQDKKVRQALVKATNTNEIVTGLGYPVIVARSPLLKQHLGYDGSITQFPQNVAEANQLLDSTGWVKGEDGIRTKDKLKLSLKLYARSTSEYAFITQVLQKQWRAVGVNAEVIMQPSADLQTTVAFHNYDVLVYGISLGTDPDVLPYWHGSQGDIRSGSRLNFSEYKNPTADRALETARSKFDPGTRTAQYRTFLQVWRDDAPAIVLYQPRFLYITRTQVNGFDASSLNGGEDRFSNVHKWTIKTTKVNQ
jgi:peptide/nickel transport system substrate-binding protein